MKKILVITAHPSDESFVFGGLINTFYKQGAEIIVVSATNGDEQAPAVKDPSNNDPSVQQKELANAAKILGVKKTNVLSYRTGYLKPLSPGELENAFEKILIDELPDAVVTFGTAGINNDPDHVKVCFAVTYAFQKYAKHLESIRNPQMFGKGRGREWKEFEYRRAFGETGEHDISPKLYYAVYPESVVSYLQKSGHLPEESFGKPLKGIEDKFVTTVITIKAAKESKIHAISAFQSMKEQVEPFILFDTNPFLSTEYYILRMQGLYEVFMGKADRVQDTL